MASGRVAFPASRFPSAARRAGSSLGRGAGRRPPPAPGPADRPANLAPVSIPGFGPRSTDGGLDFIPLPDGEPGALWLCGKHLVGPDPEDALYRAHDAHVIVCLNQRHEIEGRYPGYVAWLEANADTRALWWPVPDLHAPPLAQMITWVDELVDRLAREESVVIHCGAGMGRAPTLAVCVLVALGQPAHEAVAHVAEHRPLAGPESGAQADLVAAFPLSRALHRRAGTATDPVAPPDPPAGSAGSRLRVEGPVVRPGAFGHFEGA